MALAGALALLARCADAQLLEQTLEVPVHSADAGEPPFRQVIAVRTVRAATAARLPFVVLLHGRDGDGAQRARLALPVYPANVRYFAARGFAVIVPLRVGYGLSGGPDVEYSGACDDKHYAAAVAPAATQVRQLLEFVRGLPYVDGNRGLIVGESFGGMVALAIAAQPPPGLRGVVNIEGGDGGDSVQRPDEPCSPGMLRDTFAIYGRTARIPSLWLYSENDRLWGNRYPREWFAAFAAAGGGGAFTALPADRNNGHFIFSRNALAWQPAFERFAASLGLAPREPGRRLSRAAGASTRGSPASPSAP